MTIKNKTRLINWIGILFAIWLFIFPVFYKSIILINILIPIIGILFAYKLKGKIGIDSRKWGESSIPKIDSAIIFPSLSLILRALKDIKVIDYTTIHIFSILISLPLVCILLLGTKEYLSRRKIGYVILWIIIFTSTFGYGTTILLNSILDKSKTEYYKSKVFGKEIEKSTKGGTSYRIDFEPWGPVEEKDYMRISKYEFTKIKINDSIELKLKKGFLGSSWIPTK